jgi:hypothetical protein
MACGCNKGMGLNNGNSARLKANLQSPRRNFIAPNPQQQPTQQPPVPFTSNFAPTGPKATPPQPPPVSAADRRRIQRLNQDAIRRSLNH